MIDWKKAFWALVIATLLAAQPVQAEGLDVQKLVDDALAQKQAKVVIPAGVHQLTPSGKHGGYHLYFKNVENLEIDGTGATLVFTDPTKNGVSFDNVKGLTLRGFTVDYDPLPYTQGVITAIDADAKTYDVKLDAGYPVDETYFAAPRIAAYVYHPATRQLKNGAFDHYVNKVTQPQPGVFHLEFENKDVVTRSGTEIGDRIIISRRAATAVRFLNSEGVNVDGVTVHAAPGMAFHEAQGPGRNRYRFTLTYGPTPAGATEPRLHSANADGFHSTNMNVGPVVEDCVIEGQGDDAIAIHDNYCLVTTEGATNTLVLAPKYEFPLMVGDEMRLLDGTTYALKATAKVTQIEKLPAPTGEAAEKLAAMWQKYKSDVKGRTFYQITLDGSVPATIGDLASSYQRTGAGFVVRNNKIGPHRARGILIKAPFGIVENNTVERSNFTGIALGPEFSTWLGGDYAAGVVIRNNTVRRTGYSGNAIKSPTNVLAGAITVQARTIDNKFAPNHENAGVVIENNRIEDVASAGILVSSAKDVVIKGNTITNAWSAKESIAAKAYGLPSGAAIYVDQARDVTITANTTAPDGQNGIQVGPATESVTIDPTSASN